MSAQRALVTISENIRQVAISLSNHGVCSRAHEKDGVFKFDGFSGSAVVDLTGAGVTVLERKTDCVVFSTLVDLDSNEERAVHVAGRVCDEMLTIYRQQVMF